MASGTRKKIDGSEKKHWQKGKTGETPNPNRDKLKKGRKTWDLCFFLTGSGIQTKQHSAPTTAIADRQRSAIATDPRRFDRQSSCRKKTVFFVVFDRHSRAIADWEFPIAVALSSSNNITHDRAIRVFAIPMAIAITTSGALSNAMAICLFRR